MDWFYAQNNQQHGPVTLEALVSMLQQGHLQPEDLVWREGMPNWLPVGSVPELSSVRPASDPSLQYFNPMPVPGGTPIYAGFWLRFVAAIIDGILLGIVNFGVGMALGLEFLMPGTHRMNPNPMFGVAMIFGQKSLISWGSSWLYFAIMESSKYQATLGKMALGLIVTDLNGQPISFGRATARLFGKILSYLTIYIGFMMAGWTQQKQALHDMMAGCLVIKKP